MDAIGPFLAAIGPISLMLGFILAPVVVIVGLLWVARRRFQGRQTRFDGLFGGMARANQARNELVAGIPNPESPVPGAPGPRRRRRSRNRA
jgi:hypothetical protein